MVSLVATMWYQARSVLLLLAGCLPACGISVNYDDTEYRCNESGRCPDGFSCIEGMCVRGRVDAGAGADPIDAREEDDDDDDDLTLLRASSDPDIDIPDGITQGIIDGVQFQEDCAIVDITVDIDITHEYRGDLVISLNSPADTEVDLRDFASEEEEDDVIGTYPTTLTPDESLNDFVGEYSGGVWILEVADLDTDDVGTLNGWAVNLWCEL